MQSYPITTGHKGKCIAILFHHYILHKDFKFPPLPIAVEFDWYHHSSPFPLVPSPLSLLPPLPPLTSPLANTLPSYLPLRLYVLLFLFQQETPERLFNTPWISAALSYPLAHKRSTEDVHVKATDACLLTRTNFLIPVHQLAGNVALDSICHMRLSYFVLSPLVSSRTIA